MSIRINARIHPCLPGQPTPCALGHNDVVLSIVSRPYRWSGRRMSVIEGDEAIYRFRFKYFPELANQVCGSSSHTDNGTP
jgi:hypothetical protein